MKNIWIKRIISYILTFIVLLSFNVVGYASHGAGTSKPPGLIESGNGFIVPAGSSKFISKHDRCRRIVNSNNINIFIPFKALTEWRSSVENISGVTIANCTVSKRGRSGKCNCTNCGSSYYHDLVFNYKSNNF